jgi:hypothetical protein
MKLSLIHLRGQDIHFLTKILYVLFVFLKVLLTQLLILPPPPHMHMSARARAHAHTHKQLMPLV